MIIVDLTKRENYTHCIIGAGPAGIIAALELARLSAAASILIVDFGGGTAIGPNSLDNTIQIDNPLNHHPPDECTNKGLGGTSATWGGRCVMYDEVDFVPRRIVGDNCTWDTGLFEDLRPYLPAASRYFECGTGPFDIQAQKPGPLAERFESADVTDTVVERWSMPTRFGPRYREELERSQNIHVLLDHEARDFVMDEKGGRIAALNIRRVDTGAETRVSARQFIIAAGTQETTRLLLRNTQIFHGKESVPASLGRYYQGHVSGKIASIRFNGDPKKTEYGFRQEADGTYIRRRFQFSKEAICRENLLNTAIWLDNPLYFDPKHRSGAMSFMYLAMITPVIGKKLAPPAIAHSVTKGKVTGVHRHLWNIIRGLPFSLWIPAKTFHGRYLLKRKLPGVFLYSPENRYALHFHAEQVPVESNRMELGSDGETLRIFYHLTDEDIDSVIRCHRLLDQELRRQGCGSLEYWFPEEELPSAIRQMSKDGIHQSGTTRISDDPKTGVLDRDLKVWGVQNLHVCSASAFPTSGQANPTYLTGVFAARLADQLSKSGQNA